MRNSAVIGFGFMGKTHASNILKHNKLNLSAIVDPNTTLFSNEVAITEGNIQTVNTEITDYHYVNKYSDFETCLDNERLDAVFICVHTGLHYEMTLKALKRGLNVFLEKPFCLDTGQAEELIRLARYKGKILMVGHVVRFMQPYIKLKQMVDTEKYGKLKFLYMTRFCGIPQWGEWHEPAVRSNSGGALFDLVIHDIDFVNYILGLPDKISSNNFPGKMSNHDYISALWNYSERDVIIRIEGSNTFHSSFPFQAGFIAKFEGASVLYNSSSGSVIKVSDDKGIKEIPAGDPGSAYFEEVDYFAECIDKGVSPEICMPESSLDTIKLCYRHLNN